MQSPANLENTNNKMFENWILSQNKCEKFSVCYHHNWGQTSVCPIYIAILNSITELDIECCCSQVKALGINQVKFFRTFHFHFYFGSTSSSWLSLCNMFQWIINLKKFFMLPKLFSYIYWTDCWQWRWIVKQKKN